MKRKRVRVRGRVALAHLAILALIAASACKSYDYEEEVFLEVDGSGRFRVSGSSAALTALHGLDEPTLAAVSRYFDDDGVAITSVRETERRGRTFFHVEATFADWNAVCRHRAFEDRSCRLVLDEEAGERRLELSVPVPASRPHLTEERADESDGDGRGKALMAVRFHFPSSVLSHNAPGGIERGNILSWERPLTDSPDEGPVDIRVRFDDRSVLSTTVRILALAAGTVVTAVVLALVLMFRKGKRQLAEEEKRAERRTG